MIGLTRVELPVIRSLGRMALETKTIMAYSYYKLVQNVTSQSPIPWFVFRLVTEPLCFIQGLNTGTLWLC